MNQYNNNKLKSGLLPFLLGLLFVAHYLLTLATAYCDIGCQNCSASKTCD